MHPFFLILGPTGSGKSRLGHELAKEFGGVILNCDSVQMHQRLDVGSAKPTGVEMREIPHFLFDIVPPGGTLTAGDFRAMALEVLARELPNRPVFGVGGSGFYIQALEKGMYDIPKPDPAVDAEVRRECAHRPLTEVFAELQSLDPEYASEISPNDSYRIVRALVIIRDSGQKVSDLRREFRPAPFPYPLLKMGLAPSREELLPRLQMRTQQMLKEGLVQEVRALVEEGHKDWPALRSVGYHQVLAFLRGELSSESLAPQIVEKTMQLSKRQRTWFKRDAEIEWLPVADPLPRARERVASQVDRVR